MVFGAGGQVGGTLVAAAPPGVQVIALDRQACDVRDRQAITRAVEEHQPEVVINAAAFTAVDRAETEPDAARLLNGEVPGIIASAVRAGGARMVHLSTDFVFDGSQATPYTPADTPSPLSVYGATKLAGEKSVTAIDATALIVRTAWVYGPRGPNFFRTMLRAMHERDSVEVVADQIGTPTYAASLAETLWRLVELRAQGLYHVTDAGVASWYDFAVAIAEEGSVRGQFSWDVTVRPIASHQYPTPARRPAFSVLDKSATWALLGRAAPHWRVNLRAAFEDLEIS